MIGHLTISVVALAMITGLVNAGPVAPRDATPTSVNGADYNHPSAGPSSAWFAGATSLPASQIVSAAAQASEVPADATYILGEGESETATIYSDWSSFSSVCIDLPFSLIST
jgi:hypothetical protein